MKKLISIACSLLLLPLFASTETIYKSVDEAGNQTYSTIPPADAVKIESVETKPGPSPEQIKQARDKAKVIKQKGEALEAERKAREKAAKEDIQEIPEETSITGVNADPDRLKFRNRAKRHIPTTGPDPSDEHPIYEPDKPPPVTIQPIPRRAPKR